MSFEVPSCAAWYVIQTKPKREGEACRNLCGLGLECLFPKIFDYRIWNGRYLTIEKPLFPGYLFVKLVLSKHYYNIRWTKGVARFVGWGDMPAPIAEEVVEIIRNRMDEQGRVRMGRDLRPGQQVRIRSGPFKDLIGIFDKKVSARGRVRLLLQLVDYQASIQLHEALVERITDNFTLLSKKSFLSNGLEVT